MTPHELDLLFLAFVRLATAGQLVRAMQHSKAKLWHVVACKRALAKLGDALPSEHPAIAAFGTSDDTDDSSQRLAAALAGDCD